MNVTTIGIDLAKTVFSIHGTDQHGKVVVRKRLNCPKLLAFFAQLPPCLIGMEACSGAHYWTRELIRLGHDARIIAPRFVPIKTEDQQATLCLHRIRRGLTKERTALINQIRGLLAEFGLIIPQLDEKILAYDREIEAMARRDEKAKRLMAIPDIGPHFAAWLGLVPRQYSTGGKIRLGRITKRGDKYLRILLVHGTRAVIA